MLTADLRDNKKDRQEQPADRPEEGSNLLQIDRCHSSSSPALENIPVPEYYFQAAFRPALTLPPESLYRLRNEHPAEGSRFIPYIPEIFLQFPCDGNVLCHHVAVPETAVQERSFSICDTYAGYCHYLSENALGTLDQADNAGVFTKLDLSEKRASVPHAGITGYCANALTVILIHKMGYHISKSIFVEI